MPDQGQVIPLITQFNESFQAHKQGLKSGGDLPLNEALWMLEAGVNYEFRSEKDSIVNVEYDTVFINAGLIEDENGNYLVTGDDLMTAYEYFLANTEENLSMGEEQKLLLLADVTINEIDENQVTFGMTTGKGTELPRRCEVKDDDYWYAADEFGQCGDYVGLNIGLDASNRINELLNSKHCIKLECGNGGTLFYTNIDTVEMNTEYWWNEDADVCLEPDDIEYLWSLAETDIEYFRPTNKVFISTIYFDDFLYSTPPMWYHRIETTIYGKPNCTEIPD
jgi:hypothetical protein